MTANGWAARRWQRVRAGQKLTDLLMSETQGIFRAAGSGNRLFPLTAAFSKVSEIAAELQPSARGEHEGPDLIQRDMDLGQFRAHRPERGFACVAEIA